MSEKIPFEFRPALQNANERAIFNKTLTYDQTLHPTPSSPTNAPQLPSQQIPFQWKVEYTPLPEEKVRVLLTLKFKYRDLTWYQEEDHLKVQLTVQEKLTNQQGESIDQKADTIVLRLTPDQLKKKKEEVYHYQVSLTGRPGPHLLEITVKDDLSGGISQQMETLHLPPSP